MTDKQIISDVVGLHTNGKKRIFTGLTALVIVLSVANLLFCIGQYNAAKKPSSTVYGSGLELASTFINLDLDEYQAPEADHLEQNHTLDNMPLVVGTVDVEHPNAIRPDETPLWKTFQGVVIPHRRHILVSETVSAFPRVSFT